MPKFLRADRPEQGEPVRRAEWAEGEVVYLRPVFTTAMYRGLTRLAPVPEGMTRDAFNALPAEERRELVGEQVDNVVTGTYVIRQMAIGWTFRYDQTAEQAAAGQPGDLVPITDETIGELPLEDFRFLVGECQKRMKGLTTGPTDPGDTSETAGDAEVAPLSPAAFQAGSGVGGEAQVPAQG